MSDSTQDESQKYVKFERSSTPCFGSSMLSHCRSVMHRARSLEVVEQPKEASVMVPLVIGITIAGALLSGRALYKLITQVKITPPKLNMFGSNFYEGGFEQVMDKREASRILGIRASAETRLIMQRYRVLVKLNHPDQGGSPYLTKKINEAKELMIKGASKK